MKIGAILLARVAAILQFEDLDPRNRIGRKVLATELAKQYNFTVFPDKLEDLDIEKGIIFRVGRLDSINIELLTVLRMAIVVETRSSTDDAERVLEHVLSWIGEQTKATAPVSGRLFTSQVVFALDRSLDDLNPRLRELKESVREKVAAQFGATRPVPPYETTAVEFDADSTQARLQPGKVLIQRRADVPFTDNRYWSEAPLRTQEHIAMLGQFELLLESST